MKFERVLSCILWPLALSASAAENPRFTIPEPCTELNRNVMQQTETGHSNEAEQALSAALARDANDPGPACVGLVLANLAGIMEVSGRFLEAERFAERSVNILERIGGADTPALLQPLQTLAFARLEQWKTGMARKAFQRMLTIPAERPDKRALIHGTAAILLHKEGRLTEAESEYLEALGALEQAGRGDGADAASVVISLGSVYIDQGRFDEAGHMLDRALYMLSAAGDSVPLDKIKVLYLQAALHTRHNNWQLAEEKLKQAISLADQVEGLDPGYHAFLLTNYAQVLRKNHHRREARAVAVRAAAVLGHRSTESLVDITELTANPRILK